MKQRVLNEVLAGFIKSVCDVKKFHAVTQAKKMPFADENSNAALCIRC